MQRRLTPEWMDAPDVDPAEHRRALAGLRRINRLSRAPQVMLKPIRRHILARKLTTVRILDVASGGGDVPLAIARAIRQTGSTVELTLFDQSDVGLRGAVETARSMGIAAEARIGNAIEALPAGAYDVVTCSLFLHHLDRESCVRLLSNMKAACGGILVISDLVRSRAGLLSAIWGCHLLSRSPLVHHDGPASVRAAWTPGELHDIARDATLDRAEIRRCFACRMLLTWRA